MDFIPRPDAKVLEHVLSQRDLAPSGDSQSRHEKALIWLRKIMQLRIMSNDAGPIAAALGERGGAVSDRAYTR
jgi:hypothetical protein